MHLTVIHPFGDYKRGDKISDPAEMKRVAEGENATHVIRTADLDAPATDKESAN